MRRKPPARPKRQPRSPKRRVYSGVRGVRFVLFKSAMSDMTDRLTHEYEVFRSRNLSGYNVTYLFILQ
jgi:hypothetical protein